MEVKRFEEIRSFTELPPFKFKPPKSWRAFREHSVTYCDKICAFDIETTTLEVEPGNKQAVLYVWQFAIGKDYVIIGRTWGQFLQLVKWLRMLSGGNQIVCYIHNASYEFQFLSGIWQFENDDVFCIEPRKVLKFTLDCLEFRCSYRLTNLSLKDLTARYGVEHGKIDGSLFDYDKVRYSWTELTELEMQYIVNDVVGLLECIDIIMQLYNDDVYSIPLTSTGFVRRICRDRMRPDRKQIIKCYPDFEVFKMLRAEFRGGNTHANRYFAGEVIEGDIYNYDISSSYPSAQCNREYPVTPFQEIKNLSTRKIDKLISCHYAVLFEVILYDICLRDTQYPIPYIPIAKCSECVGYWNDNGRVIRADRLRLVVNDIDWQIIVKQYTFRAEPVRGYYSSYGPLPQELIDCNVEFFKQKTELKGVDGQELYYAKAKELLNSIYGMTVQNPAKGLILFDNCEYNLDTSMTEAELLMKAKKRAFLCYQFGCWTTAHARAALEAGIEICGVDRLLYCDTDSCKCIGPSDFTAYNEEQKALSLKSGLHATDRKGVEHYGGVYEFEGISSAFITQGAKKYAYTDCKGLHLTVSGVGKKKGAAYLADHGGLDAFKPGFVFPACGKTRSIYNDTGYGKYTIDGHELDITRNVVIEEQEYTLSRTLEYDNIIREAKAFLLKSMEIYKNNKI